LRAIIVLLVFLLLLAFLLLLTFQPLVAFLLLLYPYVAGVPIEISGVTGNSIC
jgi:hypothetical protein